MKPVQHTATIAPSPGPRAGRRTRTALPRIPRHPEPPPPLGVAMAGASEFDPYKD